MNLEHFHRKLLDVFGLKPSDNITGIRIDVSTHHYPVVTITRFVRDPAEMFGIIESLEEYKLVPRDNDDPGIPTLTDAVMENSRDSDRHALLDRSRRRTMAPRRALLSRAHLYRHRPAVQAGLV